MAPPSSSPVDTVFPAKAARAAPPALPPDRIEHHGFGAGILVGGSAEAGLLGGCGVTASAGVGAFRDATGAVHGGSFAGGGAFGDVAGHTARTAHSTDPPGAIGAFAGAGIGASTSASDRSKSRCRPACPMGRSSVPFPSGPASDSM
jgi:hypothetical protein